MVNYRNATNSDLETISTLQMQSFKEYVFFRKTIARCFRNDKLYEKFLYHLFYISAKVSIRKRICMIGEIDQTIVSIAFLKTPNSAVAGIIDYIASGGLKLFKWCNPISIFRFLAFMNTANKPCIKLKPNAWYLESLAIDNSFQGQSLGSKMIHDCVIPYIQNQSGKELVLITNSELNCRFYKKNGFTEIDATSVRYMDAKIENWSFCMQIMP